jgi:two-component sensor histidine kinase
MSEPLHVLQVDDSPSDAALIERTLRKAGYTVYTERVTNAAEVKSALASRLWDVITADYRLAEFDAPSALSLLRESGRDIPFIVVSGELGEDLAVAMMKAGAQDYLLKDSLARLGPAVQRGIDDVRARLGRKRAEQALDESEQRFTAQGETLDRQTEQLQHREIMLREIHHRVKNNMQIMSSLLSLQARTASNPETARMLEENQHRIQSMALLHEILYQSEDLASLDFSKYLLRMVDHLFRSYGVSNHQIHLHTELDPIRLELDDALPSGLLISEVVSNSLKHAFPDGREGEIRILLHCPSPTTVSLVLSDNGVGFPAGLDWATSRSLGLRLVRTLAQQLHASLEIRRSGGTEVRLAFTPKRRDDMAEAKFNAAAH